jgi:hypothetical protein
VILSGIVRYLLYPITFVLLAFKRGNEGRKGEYLELNALSSIAAPNSYDLACKFHADSLGGQNPPFVLDKSM